MLVRRSHFVRHATGSPRQPLIYCCQTDSHYISPACTLHMLGREWTPPVSARIPSEPLHLSLVLSAQRHYHRGSKPKKTKYSIQNNQDSTLTSFTGLLQSDLWRTALYNAMHTDQYCRLYCVYQNALPLLLKVCINPMRGQYLVPWPAYTSATPRPCTSGVVS